MEYKTAKDPDALLKVLSEHERAIVRLYQTCSSRFDDCADFWATFAQEELKHAACLNKLRTLLEKNFFEVFSGDGQEIREALEFLGNETARHFQILHNTLKAHKNDMGLQ